MDVTLRLGLSTAEAQALRLALDAASELLTSAGDAFPGSKSRKRRGSATPTRDRERRELLALRSEVENLNLKVLQLREAAKRGNGLSKRQKAWRHVARRQLAMRRQAEEERRRLMESLKVQAEKVEILKMKTNLVLCEGDADIKVVGDSMEVLDRLVSELDGAFALVGVVLPREELPGYDLSRLIAAACRSFDNPGGGGEMLEPVELRDERAIPFDFERVMAAVWRAWVRWHIGGASCISGVNGAYCRHADVDRPEDTFAVTFQIKCPTEEEGKIELLSETLVVRRYAEVDRLVLVWRGTSESDRDNLAGVLTDETGWIAVEQGRCDIHSQKVTGPCTAGCSNLQTLIRSYVRIIPRQTNRSPHPADANDSTGLNRAEGFAKSVAKMYLQDVNSIEREMETLLIRGDSCA